LTHNLGDTEWPSVYPVAPSPQWPLTIHKESKVTILATVPAFPIVLAAVVVLSFMLVLSGVQ